MVLIKPTMHEECREQRRGMMHRAGNKKQMVEETALCFFRCLLCEFCWSSLHSTPIHVGSSLTVLSIHFYCREGQWDAAEGIRRECTLELDTPTTYCTVCVLYPSCEYESIRLSLSVEPVPPFQAGVSQSAFPSSAHACDSESSLLCRHQRPDLKRTGPCHVK